MPVMKHLLISIILLPMTLVAKKDFPAKNLKELIAYTKANRDKVSYANAGVGAAFHFAADSLGV